MDLKYYQWVIYANYDTVCNETKNQIKKGDVILYRPKSRQVPSQVYCKESEEFKTTQVPPLRVRTGWKVDEKDQ